MNILVKKWNQLQDAGIKLNNSQSDGGGELVSGTLGLQLRRPAGCTVREYHRLYPQPDLH